MRSTRGRRRPRAYLGVDLTDRHARRPRPIDVCGLELTSAGPRVSFWTWEWDAPGEPLDLEPLLPELTGARLLGIDGPQALALPGRSLRACERAVAAAGKTPDRLPDPGAPYAGFVRSSVELFEALERAGLTLDPRPGGTGALEVYPAHAFRHLAGGRLATKASAEGRRARRALLVAAGLRGLPREPGHDRLDAAVAALVAAVADGVLGGLAVRRLGEPRTRRDGLGREGYLTSF